MNYIKIVKTVSSVMVIALLVIGCSKDDNDPNYCADCVKTTSSSKVTGKRCSTEGEVNSFISDFKSKNGQDSSCTKKLQ